MLTRGDFSPDGLARAAPEFDLEPSRARGHSRLLVGMLGAAALTLAQAQDASLRPTPYPFPPWQGGSNNPATDKGLDFTVPEVDNLADFHGDAADARLVIYMAGNSFFTMAPLVEAFQARFAQYRGKVYFETLPPGTLAKQLEAGGRVTVGNMTWTARPDVFLAGLTVIQSMIEQGKLVGPAVPYVTNELAIMVPKGNPLGLRNLGDLARPKVRLAMPNIEFEGVARQIQASLVKSGGEPLRVAVYDSKVKDGSTRLTQIHHRQTPLYLMQDKVDAGVTWQSEVAFQQLIGHPIEAVAIPARENTVEIYAGAVVTGAAHASAAADWLDFIASDDSFAVFGRYGFKRYRAPAPLR